MTKIKFIALKGVTTINGSRYPMFTGFLSAKDLKEIADVPSFLENKDHDKIAADVIRKPINEWQRPEYPAKIEAIKTIYGNSKKDNLMANPVLLGSAVQNFSHPKVSINIIQKTLKSKSNEVLPVDNLYEIEVIFDESLKRPIWILDGQHRIKGLAISVQKNEMVPFVLLHDSTKYDPPFLAEIFTHVTTGAKPMEPLHGEWMRYAFDLESYQQKEHKFSMETTIHLCMQTNCGGQTNPFHNLIQFNPYSKIKPKWNAFDLTAIEWENIIHDYYYSKNGKFSPLKLAEEIIKSTRAFENLDSHAGSDSKLFSPINTHKILAEAYLIGLLSFLAKNNTVMSYSEWIVFYSDSQRAVDKCDFSLPFASAPGAMSSSFNEISRKIAQNCFIEFFCQPSQLNSEVLTDFLQGMGGNILITSYDLKKGKKEKKSAFSKSFTFAAGKSSYNLSSGGVLRKVITVTSPNSNVLIKNVKDRHFKPAHELKKALTKSGEDISGFGNHYELEIEYMAYSGDTINVLVVRFDK